MRRLSSLIMLVAFLFSHGFFSESATASETPVIAESRYVMADGDTLAVAEERVLQRAQRRAVEEAGVYLESTFRDSEKTTGSASYQSSALEIRTLAAAITKTEILELHRSFEQDRPVFHIRIRALVDLGHLQRAIRRWESEQQLAEHFRQLQKENAELKTQLHDVRTRSPRVRMLAIEPPARHRSPDRAKTLMERVVGTHDLRHKLDLASQAAGLDPGSSGPLVIRGQTYLRLASGAFAEDSRPAAYSGYIDNARMDFDRALIIDPENTWALLGQGDVDTWLQRPEAAAMAYEQALRLNPFFDMAQQRLIHLHTSQAKKLASENQWPAALVLLDRLLTQSLADRWIPDLLEAYLLRGEAHQRLGQPGQAIGDLDRVLQVDPSHTQALFARGRLHRDQFHASRAKADFEHACLLGSTEACEQLP